MTKTRLPERQLIENINDALAAAMPPSAHSWEVRSLRRVHKPTVNWEVNFEVSGPELTTIEQHRDAYRRVLEELEAKYDVDWSAQIDEA